MSDLIVSLNNPDFSSETYAAEPIYTPAASSDADYSRVTDIAISLALIVFLGPLMLLIATLLFIDNPGPIFFAHRRLGKGGREFRCLKFRTMVPDADARLAALLERDPIARAEWERDHKLRRDPRITSFGRMLRRVSFDELPQLFNVLRGDMSLVGPRPIVRAEAARYGRYFHLYCRVRPGITGLWQVCGRNDVSYRRRIALDTRYVRTRTLRLDAWILARTLGCVLRSSGY